MMNTYPLRLERYFFTEQHVIANPDFQEEQPHTVDFGIQTDCQKLDDQRYGISVGVKPNYEQCANLAYHFSISTFGVVQLTQTDDPALPQAEIEMAGTHILIGVIRARLAEMTAISPWGTLYLDFVPLNASKE